MRETCQRAWRKLSGLVRRPVRVQGNSVVFSPRHMKLGHFYLVELENEPYLYRKVSEHEVEVCGLAEQTNRT